MTAYRICAKCRGKMIPDPGTGGDSPFIWSDRHSRFTCRDCGHTADLTAPSSIVLGMLTGGAGLALLAWGLTRLDGVTTFLGAGPGGMALGAGAALVILVLALGGLVAAWSAFRNLRVRLRYPAASPGSGLGRLAATLGVSALPVLLAVGFGFYDYYVRDLDDFAVLILPVIFSPLLLGTKLGLSFLGLFLGCAMWMGMLVTGILMS